MSIETNLNQSPYFDDFSEDKNFYRVLFRPGYAVQARELTQLQTMLQNQISKFANEVMIDGTLVTGGGLITDHTNYIKLRDRDANNALVTYGGFFDVGKLANCNITGESSGVTAKLVNVLDGGETEAPNYLTAYCHYTNSGSDGTKKSFDNDETLLFRNNTQNGEEFRFAAKTIQLDSTGKSLKASIESGICYHKGNFIKLPSQNVIVGRYDTTPSAYIGLTTTETIIDSNGDYTLLDGATGSSNYNAPGADRLKIYPKLTVKDYGEDNTASFFKLATVEGGSIVSRVKETVYSDVGKFVAERLYDAHGNYVVKPFNLRVREHLREGTDSAESDSRQGRYFAVDGGDASKLICEVERGSGYVSGHQISLEDAKPLPFDKSTETFYKPSLNVGQGFGNYVKANNVCGEWDIQDLTAVKFYDGYTNNISDGTFTIGTTNGTYIGDAFIRGFQWDTGTPGTPEAEYRMYIFNVKMVDGYSFSSVRSMAVNPSGTPLAFCDISDVSGTGVAKIHESELSQVIFPLGQKAAEKLKNDAVTPVNTSRWVYRTGITGQVATSGLATYTLPTLYGTGGTDSLYDVNGSSPITNPEERNNYILVATQNGVGYSYPSNQYINSSVHTDENGNISSTTSPYITITGSGTNWESEFSVGDWIFWHTTTANLNNTEPSYARRIVHITSDTKMTVHSVLLESGQLETDLWGSNSGAMTSHTAPSNYHSWVCRQGQIINLEVKGTLTASSSTTLSFDLQRNLSGSTGFSTKLYLNVLRSNSVEASKLVEKNKFIAIDTSTHPNTNIGPWHFGVSDAYKIENIYTDGVYDSPNSKFTSHGANVTGEFDFDNGQRDTFYDTSSITLKPESTLDITSKHLIIEFSYFKRASSTGTGYFSVDSYPLPELHVQPTNAQIRIEEIPIFTSRKNGAEYDLRDCIDMRPTRPYSASLPVNAYDTAQIPINPVYSETFDNSTVPWITPTPDENFICDAHFYLARKDRVVVSQGSSFHIQSGVPSLSPKTPPEIAGGMTLGILEIPPYPSLSPYVGKMANRSDYSVKLSLENNRRYTMKDLRAVDSRVRNLEYYSTLNLLEAQVNNKQLFSDTTSADRYKNGLFVDSMSSHTNSNLKNKYYRAAIDVNEGVLRPTFTRSDIALQHTPFASDGVVSTGNLILLDHTEKEFIDQPYASKMRNPVQELMFNWRGQVTLDPAADNVPDITEEPDIQLDFSGFYDAIEILARHSGLTNGSIQWGGWAQSGSTRTRSGVSTTLDSVTETISLGNTIENISTRDFMRSKTIRFTGFRLRPNTRVYAFFDDEAVSSYCTPTDPNFNDAGVLNDPLITDDTGSVYGTFIIPDDENLRFRVGTRRFVLKDVENPITEADLVTTTAHGEYQSNPLDITMRGTDVNMQIPEFSQQTHTGKQTLHRVADGDRYWWDPMAQTFTVNVSGDSTDGVYVTKLDLFFGKKPSATEQQLPITLQIREVVNGNPTELIVPNAIKTLTPSEITTSTDSSAATSFVFDSPIYLRNSRDYAFIVIPGGNSDQYALWTAELGGLDVLRANTLINKQTYSGVLFSSSNDKTWNPIQDEDFKFKIFTADFSTTGNVMLHNKPQDFFTVDNIEGRFRMGEQVRSESILKFEQASGSSPVVGTVIRSKTAYNNGSVIDSNYANGTIRQIISEEVDVPSTGTTTYTVKIDAYGTFPTSTTDGLNDIYNPSGTAFGDTVDFTANNAVGNVSLFDMPRGKMHLDEVGNGHHDGTKYVGFANSAAYSTNAPENTWIRGQKSGASCRITSIDDLLMNTIVPKVPQILHAKTNIDWQTKVTSSSGIKDDVWSSIDMSEDNNFHDKENMVFSKSNELIHPVIDGSSLDISGLMTSDNNAVSPIIDNSRMNGIILGNIINDDLTNEKDNYGNAHARYVSKRVELGSGQDAEDMVVFIDAFKPIGTDVTVYAKIINGEDDQSFDDKDFSILKQVTPATLFSAGVDGTDLKEYEYTFSANTDGSNFLGSDTDNQAKLDTNTDNIVAYRSNEGDIYYRYKSFAIKIVMTSSIGTNVIPLIDNLRVVALQK
jgi:hypothetical protein